MWTKKRIIEGNAEKEPYGKSTDVGQWLKPICTATNQE